MPAGRPPKPLEDHLTDGTYREDRHGPMVESIRPEGFPVKPEDLDEAAGAAWEFIINELTRMNVAGKVDSIALAEGCRWLSRYYRFGAVLDGARVSDDVDSALKLTKLVALCWSKFESTARQFGLTPADRARLKVQPTQKKQGVASRARTA